MRAGQSRLTSANVDMQQHNWANTPSGQTAANDSYALCNRHCEGHLVVYTIGRHGPTTTNTSSSRAITGFVLLTGHRGGSTKRTPFVKMFARLLVSGLRPGLAFFSQHLGRTLPPQCACASNEPQVSIQI